MQVRISIGVKLIAIISFIVIAALTTMNLVSGWFIVQDRTASVWEANASVARLAASQVSAVLDGVLIRARLLVATASGIDEAERAPLVARFFADSADIAGVASPGGFAWANPLLSGGVETLASLLEAEADRVARARSGETVVFNASQTLRAPFVGILVPMERAGAMEPVLVLASAEQLMRAVDSGDALTTVFAVNGAGGVIAHRDAEKVLSAVELGTSPIVKEMRSSSVDAGVKTFDDPGSGVKFMGAFRKTPFAGIGVVSMVEEARTFESVNAIQRRNWLLLVAAIAIAVATVYFYSKTIIVPVRALARGAVAIQNGKFDLDLKATTRDELGMLTSSFVQMGKGLAEREKLKDTFGKFVNKEIAEKVLKGDLKLGGERRRGTIFFSDIRSFTSISENLEPEQVVEFLNQYMSLMVGIINRTHGNVDKFIGDAIMAVWGIPVSYGNDAINALDAALDMRKALLEFNRDRGGPGKPIIRIGCGLNTGNVLAGQIGSNERMEYTVIGDAVNLASRIESLNKPMGTDILVSADTWEQTKDVFHFEKMLPIMVKGKAEPQATYALLGRKGDPDALTSLAAVRELLGIPAPDLSGFDPEAEEKKYKLPASPKREAK